MKVRYNQVLVYHPNGLDRVDGRTGLKSGDVVKVIKVQGCPAANVMGHCYVGDEKTGKFIGMVSTNSLHTKADYAAYKARLSVLLTLRLLGATNAPKAAWGNVEGGEAAWGELVKDAYIAQDGGFWVLSAAGRNAIS